jgi:hypothetical protein
MGVGVKDFGPYGIRPRVRDEIEKDIAEWIRGKSLKLKDILPVTASLPDRTTLLLVFYNTEEEA